MSDQTFKAKCVYGQVELRSGFDEQGRGWGRRIARDRDGNVISDTTEFTGCVVTFGGVYKTRTFWQWLTRQPRELQSFRIGL